MVDQAGFTPENLNSDVYRELRGIAARQLARLPARPSLQPTELVHEAFLRLVPATPAGWRTRGHFFGAAAQAIRNALVDHLRTRGRQKRYGSRTRVSLSGAGLAELHDPCDALSMEEALLSLERHDPRVAKTVVLRVVGGMTVQEVARALGVSVATAERDWTYGRAWLHRELRGGEP
ncbi:MAG TPA: ECF-type sigma factor [Candidatus Polarisedimenticolaceae bacterium]|nr:ECF-type sigma factor [Candidatus Polarisedimenticolaceae bacterium]